jgi:hypothetical protein
VFFQEAAPATIDQVDKLVRIFGIPAIVGAIAWLVLTYDRGTRALKEIKESTEITKATVITIQTNHLEHLAEGMSGIAKTQADTAQILISMDKTLGILSDRTNRS